jgi:NADPH:quinone reductase-like Zn-dependent oxidoreductase
MKAIRLPNYNKNVLRAMLSLRPEETDIPRSGEDEVLVKMHAAVCNPSDIAFIRGEYNIVKSLPAVPGFEGSGTIVEASSDLSHLTGKKVSCFVQHDGSGTWAEYFVVKKGDFLLLDDGFDLDQAAAFSVNPFTAYGLMEIARIRESEAIIQNAAGGQVAALVNKMAETENIKIINIVRKEETAQQLKQAGWQYVLNELDERFSEQLLQLSHELNATTAFDAVGGPLAGQMFNALAPDAELVAYGGLSGKRITDINEMDLIFRNKLISGFNLIDWKDELDPEDFDEINRKLQEQFMGGELKTVFRGTTSLDEIVKGLKGYIGNMSGGKMLIKSV